MADEFNGARVEQAGDGARVIPALNTVVDHVVGTTATLITRPTGMSRVALSVENGNFRIASGDRTADLATTAPPSTTYEASGEEGQGGLLLKDAQAGVPVLLPAPSSFTVVGSAAGAILTFWFLP